MIQNDFTIHIRRAESGDEACLAHVQTESWKAAFAGIVPEELLTQCTSIERAEKMYAQLLAEQRGNGYILELDGKPHCVAWWWDAAREEGMPGAAELRCIHSLPENWRRGCGSWMMERVLADVKAAGYTKAPALVFTDNVRAIRFLRSAGLHLRRQKAARVRHNGGNVRPSVVKPYCGTRPRRRSRDFFSARRLPNDRSLRCRNTGYGIIKKSRAKHVLPWTGTARRHQQQRRRV